MVNLVPVLVLLGGVALLVHRAGYGPDVREAARESLARTYPRYGISRRRLPRVLLREALGTVTVGVSGACVLPAEIDLLVNPKDLEPFSEALGWLAGDVEAGVRDEGASRGWHVPIDLTLVIVPDINRTVGAPRAVGRLRAVQEDHGAADTFPAEVGMVPTELKTRTWPLVTIQVNDGPATTLAVSGEGLTIGRGPTCDLVVSSVTASRLHCRVRVNDEGLLVEDLSRNGTAVYKGQGGGLVVHVGQDVVSMTIATDRPAVGSAGLY